MPFGKYANPKICDEKTIRKDSDLLQRKYGKVLLLGLVIAVFQQWCGTNVIFNYAQEIFVGADFDGDQMAVHLPLGNAAILEALPLMMPKPESDKVRRLAGRAFLDFPVNETVIYPDYRLSPPESTAHPHNTETLTPQLHPQQDLFKLLRPKSCSRIVSER